MNTWFTSLGLAAAAAAGISILPLAGAAGAQDPDQARPSPPIPVATTRPPTPPPTPSPVDVLRQLLRLDAAARDAALAARAEPQRALIRAKLAEFDALETTDRERRLRLLELHWHLRALLRMNPAERAARLREVPPALHAVVAERLAQWDRVPPRVQTEFLERLLAPQDVSAASPPSPPGLVLSPDRRQQWEASVSAWGALPDAARHKVLASFERFFQLPESAREKALASVSVPQPHELRSALDGFEQLAPEQRRACLDSVHHLASLSAEQRAQFLRYAGRWLAMPESERSLHRRLAAELPPLPPGFSELPTPPSPPGLVLWRIP
jgi:hypothetical protein